jgi:hypothetical protein
MLRILKTSLIFSIVILFISSAYIIISNENEEIINKNEDEIRENENNEDNDYNESDEGNYTEENDGNNSNNELELNHYVFVEAGTTVCCNACAKVHKYLDEIYESQKYPFYYVAMPIENNKAVDYLKNYNIYAYPTVYFDGGYEVIMGGSDWESLFEEKISSTISRNVSKVSVNITGILNENNDEINFNIMMKNYEEKKYTGKLKVYLAEVISTKWQGDQPYKYAFIDFIINENIEILPKQNNSISKTIDSSELDPENLIIFAVIFNSEKHIKYSFPPDQKPFDAYYADSADATLVIEDGNLPPMVGISSPTIGYLHLFSNPLKTSIFGKTILLGRAMIIADVSDDSSIQKVDFYINEKLMKTITEEPYEWQWHQLTFGKKTITIIAYDDTDKISSATLDVFVLMKWKNPLLMFFN